MSLLETCPVSRSANQSVENLCRTLCRIIGVSLMSRLLLPSFKWNTRASSFQSHSIEHAITAWKRQPLWTCQMDFDWSVHVLKGTVECGNSTYSYMDNHNSWYRNHLQIGNVPSLCKITRGYKVLVSMLIAPSVFHHVFFFFWLGFVGTNLWNNDLLLCVPFLNAWLPLHPGLP